MAKEETKKSNIKNILGIVSVVMGIVAMLFALFVYFSSPSHRIDLLEQRFLEFKVDIIALQKEHEDDKAVLLLNQDKLLKKIEDLKDRMAVAETELAVAKVERLNQTKNNENINKLLGDLVRNLSR